ncbi:MAG TPA: hypothetical protein VFU47_17865, partial [Armatimonadota bacterium]|nr:hypothetical protein [Armatimonadota bacterium]
MSDPYDRLQEDGFALVPTAFPETAIMALITALQTAAPGAGALRRGTGVYALRNVLESVPAARGLVACREMRALVEPIL